MIKKNQLLALMLFLTILISCTKDEGIKPTSLLPPPPSLLSGQEILFDSLSWIYYNSGFADWDEIYVTTPARPDLFLDYLDFVVFVRFDTSNNWMEVKSSRFYNPNLPIQYLYQIYRPYSFLVVNVWPLNHQLIGRKAAIKIKFL